MKVLKTYNHGSNALYVREQLNSHGIKSFIEEAGLNFKILVNEKDIEKSEKIITKLDIDDSEVRPDSEGYLAGHNEWTDKMYDPGHYTGGKIPHFLLDKSNWKIYGPWILIMGLITGYLLIKNGINVDDGEIIFFTLLYIFCGYSIIKQLIKRRK